VFELSRSTKSDVHASVRRLLKVNQAFSRREMWVALHPVKTRDF